MMQNINVTRYAQPKRVGWAGYIEPADLSWIMYVGLDGKPLVFLNRDPESGAILGDDASKHPEELARLRAEREGQRSGGHIGEKADGSADYGGAIDPHAVGERIHPLGIDGTGGVGVLP